MGKATDILNRRKKYGSTYVNAEYDTAKNSTAALDVLNNRRIDKLKKELNSVDIKSLYEYKDFGLSEDKKKEYKATLSNYKSALESLKKYDLSFSDDKYNKILQDIDLLSNKFDVLSNYKTESEYNDALQILKTQDEMRDYDSVSGGASIEELKSKLSSLEKEKNDFDTSYKANGGWIPSSSNYNRPAQSQIGAYNEWNTKSSEYAKQIKDLENEIYQKEKYHTEAIDLQEFEGFQEIDKNGDFEEVSQKGLSRKNPSPNLVETIEKGEDGKWYTTGGFGKKKEIKNILTFVRDNADSLGNVKVNEDFQKFLKADEDEVKRYSYLLEVDEKKAQRYLDLLMPSLLDDRSEDLKEKLDVPVLKHIASVGQGMANYVDSVGIKDYSNDATMVAMQKLQAEAKGLDRYLLGAGQNIGNMLPSIVLSYFTSGLASGLGAAPKVASAIGSLTNASSVGISAKGSAYKQKIAEGWNPDDAQTYSTLIGVSEASLEAILSGIVGTTGFGAEDLLKKADMIDNALLRFTAKSSIRLGSEELEEIAQLFLEPTFEVIVKGGDYDQPTIDELIETAIVTAISTGTLNSPASISEAVDNFKQAQLGRAIKAAGETRNLVDLGKSLGEETKSYEYANKITDKSRGYAIGKLLNAVKGDIPNANKVDMIKSFEEKGYNTKEANLLVNKMTEQGLDSVANIRGMRSPAQTYNDVLSDPNSSISQRNEAYRGIEQNVELNQLQRAIGKATKNKSAIASHKALTEEQGNLPTQEENPVESKFESNTEGKDFDTTSGKIIASKKLVSSAKDDMAFEVTYDDGTTETVDAKNISFGNDGEALVYSTVMDMNVPVGIAEQLISGYNGNDVKSAATYVNGMREAFVFGKYNQEADLNNGQYASKLTEEQRNNAFKVGGIYTKEKAIADEKAIKGETKPTDIKKQDGKVHFEGDKLSLKSVQDVSLESLGVLSKALGKDFHIYESYVENGRHVYKDANGNIKKAPNGFYDQKDGSIWIDLNAGNHGEGTMMYTVAHELTHFIKQWSPTKFKALADFLVEQYGKEGVSVHQLALDQQKKAKENGRNISYDVAFEEMVADSMETMLTDGKVIRELAHRDKGLFDKIKSWIDNLLRRLNKEYKNYSPETQEGQMLREMKKTFEEAQRLFTEALTDASDNFAIKGTDKAFVENYLKTKDVVYNLRAAESHQEKLVENYTSDASIDLETLQKRYAKVIGIWEKLGGELNSKFLNEWNNKVGKDRAFTIFKAQAGYKYNVELSSMCKKGVPLFEAIDTIVKKEVMNELKTKTLGKAEKEILYDILKNHNFEIPCAICYVEQARQREGVIINDFLDGKIEKNAKGKVTKYKLGWNDVLNRVEKEMKKNGVDYTFRNVDKSIATDSYAPVDIVMDEATQDAFYKALKKVANAEIVRWNREDRKSNQKERRQITGLKPQTIKEVFKGTLPSNLKIFKVLFNNPSSRFKISRDLLYSSATTLNLANAHNDLYSLFNSQGGVAGYKTKQAPIVYWGDILGKSWKPSTVRKEGGIRNQSNSDFQMYTLLDQAQMYIDFSAKGYYLQAYTKVLAELKLFGLSRGKINASLIPQVIEYKNADGSVNWEKTMENAGLDENGNPIYDDFEGINHTEAFMLIEDAEYSKNICGICIGYSDNHIRKLLDDNRVQQIIGFHDKTDNPEKRYRGAKYSKNYNGLNEAVKVKADGTEETVHVGFNQFVSKAEKMFKFNKKTETFEGTVNHNGKEYSANDIPRLAADLYLEMCAEKNYRPAYNDFSSHKNYYKLLADFGLYDSQGNYAPHQKVQYNMPDKVPYLDKNGNKAYMSTEAYIKAELQKELTVRDSISEALADTSENGIIPQFVERVNALHTEKADTKLHSDRDSDGNELSKEQQEFFKDSKVRDENGNLLVVYHGSPKGNTTIFDKSVTSKDNDMGQGIYFSTNISDANEYRRKNNVGDMGKIYRGKIYSAYVNIENPFVVSESEKISLTDALNLLKLCEDRITAKDVWYDLNINAKDGYVTTSQFANSNISTHMTDILAKSNKYDGIIDETVATKFELKEGTKHIIVLDSNQIKETTNTKPTTDPDIRHSSRIEADMSEEKRYEILKDKKIQPQEIEIDKDFDIEFSFLENNIKSIVEKPLISKLQELGYLKKYTSNAIDVEFEFTGSGVRKSIHSQENHYGGNLGDFAKVVLNMQKLLDNSVLLEIHADKGKGTPRENPQLIQTYVLLSAFREGNLIKPVQFEVKQYVDNNNRLYLAVALTKIETGVKGNTIPQNEASTSLLPVSEISITDLFKNVNIKDAKFLKYAPNQFLNEEQIKAKEKELEEDREKYSIKESIRVANTELASMDDTALYIKNTKKANYIGMIFNGTKTEETRSRRTLDAFIGKDFYVTDGEKVYGTIVLGEPHKYTEEEFHKLENQKKHRVPKGDEYDVKPGGSKWAYPIESYERFNKPKKLSDSKEYMNSFQARQVLYSERDDTSVSTRSLLANALEGTAVKPEERNLLRNYKTNLRLIDGEQAKLDKVREEYNEIKYKKSLSIGEDKLSIAEFEKRAKDLAEKQGQDAEKVKFKLDRSNSKYIAYVGDVVKGQILSADKSFRTEEDAEKLQKLSQEAKLITTRINSYDRELFKLENMKPLKDVLTREKELARKRQKQKDAENLREYKEKVAKTTRELLDRNRKSRERAVEGRNKTKMRHKVKKIVNDLNNLLLKPTKERHVPEEMRVAVSEALAIVNMDTVDAETRVARYNELIAKEKNPDVIASLTESRDRILNQGNKLGEKLDKLKNAYGMIKASSDGLTSSLYDDVIYSKIESVQKIVGKTALRNMTLEQLNNVYDLYKMVLTTVRDSNKAFAENLKMTRQALGSNTFEEIKENNKAKDRIRFEGVKKFGWKYLKPMLAIKTIGSETLQKLWNNILYGQEVFAQDYDEAVKFAKETKEKYGYDKWDLLKQYSFESKSGKVMKINLEQMMSIYAYSKRKQADDHIEKGGILLNESIIKEKKLGRTVEVKVNDSTAYRLDKMQVGEIIATLEKEFHGAKDFVDEMQKYLSETMGEKGNEVSMKMYGIKLFNEEHYFPLKSSKEFMESANDKLKGDVKVKNKGMTKATVEHASNPIVLEGFLDVWGNHVNEMSMYHGLVLPLEDFSRTLNYSFKADEKLNTDAESVKTALGSAFGESAEKYLNELMTAINGGVLHDSSAESADKMISQFKKSKVMASLSVIVQQPTAIIRAMGIIEPKYFTSQNFHHKQTWEELKKYCPTAIIKETGSFDTNMGRTIVDMIKEDRKLTEKVGDALGKAPAYMDEMGWNMIWRALKKKVATEQNLSGEELLKECGRQMTLIVNETQVYDSVMSRNELMRSKSVFTKMATAFMGEPTTVANMIYGAALDLKRGKKGMAGKTIAAVVSSVVINGLVSSLVYAFRDDDEEKTFFEKYLSSATTEVIDGFNLLTYIPFVKDAYSLFQGYDVERTDMALIGDVVDALDDFYKVLDPEAYEGLSRKEIAKHIYENASPLLTSICDMFGLPVGNILRDAEAIIVNDNLPLSKTSEVGTDLAIKDGLINASPKKLIPMLADDEKYQKLYLIANNGDSAYVKNEVAEMVAEKFDSYKAEEDSEVKAEKKAKQSVKSSFTATYRDEYKKAFKKKDANEMNRIRKFLYATGLWVSLRELDNLLTKWREEA